MLVSRIYRCERDTDHRISATHANIIRHVELKATILFKLTVKSGYLLSLSEGLCAMVDSGMSFLKVEETIRSIYDKTGRSANSRMIKDEDYP